MPRPIAKRLFLAVPLPDTVRSNMSWVQKELEITGADVKWVEPHNGHITLKFLGDVPLDKIPSILSAIKKTLSAQKAFLVTLDCLDAFPSNNTPRIIWIGSRQRSTALSNVAVMIETALASLGFKKDERPFLTHASLGRVRSSQNKIALIEKMYEVQTHIKPQTFSANAITLMESRLASTGPTYTLIEKFDLA